MELDAERLMVEPERRKGDQGPRFGTDLGRGGFMTPSQAAAWNLYKSLKNYSNIADTERQSYQSEFMNMPNLKSMNMETLAAVLSFLKDHEPSVENFKNDVIVQYMHRLIKEPVSDEERAKLIIMFKAQFLRYIRAIINYREEDVEDEEEEY